MAAIAATITGVVLIKVGDAEPVEVGVVEIPIHVSTSPAVAYRGSTPPEGGSGVSRPRADR